jgi:hypothetical protein
MVEIGEALLRRKWEVLWKEHFALEHEGEIRTPVFDLLEVQKRKPSIFREQKRIRRELV